MKDALVLALQGREPPPLRACRCWHAPLALCALAVCLAVTPDGRYIVVANTIERSLSVLDATSDRVVATIPADNYPNDVLIVL